ncbi:MAG: AMP-binding protein, partial [Acidimicrobiia bacterium]
MGNAPVNVASILDGHPDDVVALISRNRETTYGELRDQVARMRGGLAGLGVQAGDRVAIVCGNNRYFVVSYFAIVGLGAVAVPVNPESPGPELQQELASVEPCAVVVGPAARTSFAKVDRATVPSVRIVVQAEADAADLAAGATDLADLLGAEPMSAVDVEPDHLAALLFTSGTAGPPRAAMLSHRNLLSNIEQDLTTRDHTDAGDVVYGVLPLFHIFGLNVVLGVSMRVGATVLLVQRFDPSTAVQSIVQRGITVVPGAPPMWIAFSQFDELPADSFASVRLAASGASRLSPVVADRFRERFGVEIHEGYGLTEASPVVTSSLGIPPRPGSVGRGLVGIDIRLVGD